MLREMLRVLLRRILFIGAMKGREKAEEEFMSRKEEDIPKLSTSKKNLTIEERVARVQEYMDSLDRYTTRPLMAETYEMNMFFLFKIYVVIAVVLTIGIICMTIYSLEEKKYIALGISLLMFIWLVAFLIKFCQKYMEKTKCIYYNNRIVIKRYLRKDKEITYAEMKEYINKRKIKVHNGRFELPYSGGKIPVYTWGEPMSANFYKFISEKCDIKMPEITQAENDIVRKTGTGWTFYTFLALPSIAIGTIMGLICCIPQYGFDDGIKVFLCNYFKYLFSFMNVFGVMGVAIIIVGIILKVVNYFPAKKHFKAYRDIIKVSIF